MRKAGYLSMDLKRIVIIFISSFLFLNAFLMMPGPLPETASNSQALSTFIDESGSDFNSSYLNNVFVTPEGNVELSTSSRNVRDDFFDLSRIGYTENMEMNYSTNKLELISGSVAHFGGSNNDAGWGVCQASDGGFLINGITESYCEAGINRNIWAIKTDASLQMEWNRIYRPYELNQGRGCINTSDGGYLLTGETYTGDDCNGWLIKLDQDFNEEWNRTYGCSDYNPLRGSIETSDGGFLSFGDNNDSIYGDVAWLVKTDSSGNEEWNRTYGTDGSGGSNYWYWFEDLEELPDGGFLVLAWGGFSAGIYWDGILIKINNTGIVQWQKVYSWQVTNYLYSMCPTNDGGYILAGRTGHRIDGTDAWLIKTNSTGAEIWNRTYYTTYNAYHDYARRVYTTDDGGYIFIGETGGDGDKNSWLVRTDGAGNIVWQRTYGGAYGEIDSVGVPTADGGYVIAGYTFSMGSGGADVWLVKTDDQGNVTQPEGTIISKDLLEGKKIKSIDNFDFRLYLPEQAIALLQFSKDNVTWYDSTGVLNGWEYLNGTNDLLDLSALNWNGPEFYYKMKLIFNGINKKKPGLDTIRLFYTECSQVGTIESRVFQTEGDHSWKTLSWSSTEPTGTSIKFQLRSAGTEGDLVWVSFVGPDGTTDTYYTTSGTPVWAGHGSDSWMQYKAYLETSKFDSTPVLSSVTLSYNYWPFPPMVIAPSNYFITNDNRPLFTWQHNDSDSSYLEAFQLIISRNNTFSKIDYDSGEQTSAENKWQFPLGTEYSSISDGTWYWKVRTKDDEGDWGPYSPVHSLLVDTIAPSSSISSQINEVIYNRIEAISGEVSDSEDGAGINYTEITILRSTDNYFWNGSAWGADKVWLKTALTGTQWTFDAGSIVWTSDTEYELRSRAVDNAGNVELPGVGIEFSMDMDVPSSIINCPLNNTWLNKLDIISGRSFDTGGAGLKSVEICIMRSNDGHYWDGLVWGSPEKWLSIKNTDRWSYNTSEMAFETGYHYTISARATDNAGNVKISDPTTFMFDNLPTINRYIYINHNQERTNGTSVILTISATDPDSGVHQISYSTDGHNWSDWENYTESKSIELPSGDGEKIVYLRVMDRAGNIAEPVFDKITLFTMEKIDEPEKEREPIEPGRIGIVATTGFSILFIILFIFISVTEVGRYKFFSIAAVPLYNKLNRDKVLENFKRGKIYGYIVAKPGENYNSIKKSLRLNNGTLAHHARILEREEYIYSKRDGILTRFYPTNKKAPDQDKHRFNEVQKALVDLIHDRPGLTQKEIVDQLGVKQPNVSLYLTDLVRDQIVRVEHVGRENRYYINEYENGTAQQQDLYNDLYGEQEPALGYQDQQVSHDQYMQSTKGADDYDPSPLKAPEYPQYPDTHSGNSYDYKKQNGV